LHKGEALTVTTPKQARARQTFDNILDASAVLLMEEGIEGLNTNEVARQAGVNISTLYRYFDDKYDLVEGLLTRLAQFQLDKIAEKMEHFDEPRERLDHILELQLQIIHQHPWLGAAQHAMRAAPQLRKIRDANREYIGAGIIEQLGRRGKNVRGPFDLGKRQAAATQMLVEIFGSGLTVVADAPKGQRPALLDELKVLLNAYLDTMNPP